MADDICDIAHDQATAWRDALDDDHLEDARSVAIQQPQSMDAAMYCDIQVIIGHLIAKAPQLLGKSCIQYMLHHSHIYSHLILLPIFRSKGNFTTNLAELWMHVRCKFDGGKQVNRSQGGAWEGRCAGAGLRQNFGPHWGPKAWQTITGEVASSVFKDVSQGRSRKVEKD